MVYISHIRDTKKLNACRDRRWAHIACRDDIEFIYEILDENNKISTAKLIESISEKVRNNFIHFVGQLANQQENKILWYSCRLASKSVSQTDVFHQYVYIKLVEELARQEANLLIVTDNDDFLYNLSRLKMDDVEIMSNAGLKRDKLFYKGFRKILKFIVLWALLVRRKDRSIKDVTCYLHMWIDDRLFNHPADTQDPYWGGLEKFLSDQGFKTGRLAPLSVPVKFIGKAEKHVPNIIYPLAYVNLIRLVKCMFTRFNIFIDQRLFQDLADLEILMHLTQQEVIKERASKHYLDYLLYYYAYKGIGAFIFDTATIIYLYENQPWEKMLNLAFTGCNRIGYQHATIPYNWLDYYTSEYETAEPRPSVVLTSGECWTRFLERSNKGLKVKEAGTIRYNYLFDQDRRKTNGPTQLNIVVALPIDPVTALPLQNQILKVLENKKFERYHFVIKPHPHLPGRYLKSARFGTFKNVTITVRPVTELLQDCGLLISIDSTVAFESVFAGVKTLNYIPDELTMGIEQFISQDSYSAYDSNFSEKLFEALESQHYPQVNISRYFSPINYEMFHHYAKVNLN